MNKKVWLASRAAAVGAHMATEKLRPTEPRTVADVPSDGVSLTTEWLTAVLCAEVPGAQVVSWHSPGGSSGTSARAALRVTYNAAGQAACLPTQLFTKSTKDFSQRLLLGAVDCVHGETYFYLDYRPKIDMEAAVGYWGGVDDASWRSMILMEDIAATRGAKFVDATERLTHEHVRDALSNLAAMHGTWWNSPALNKLKTPIDHYNNVADFIDMEGRCKVGLTRARRVIPDVLHPEADRLWEGTRASLQLLTEQTPTLLHGDSHVGQTYVTGDGRMGWTDWQVIERGNWAYDVAYFLGSACDPDDRRAWERELLEHYLQRLSDAGGDAPNFDDAWDSYRRSMFYPYSAWAMTIGRAWYQPKMQPEAVCLSILHRLSTAIVDLDSFAVLGI
ncbi:hypothetical protein BOO86_16025 [Mycobacterium sp. CBMA 234]|uniref:phosphotransferase n=1 Tax=Mycolicibacterium sp. CBMA 234 TaxID=1918495 RepID=UPI0012DCA8C3|nr:phosphotransferase [Mycolicibacterium sp. CBMA 234]MUL65985.1 hypothetical protein [Mycolicibacterium sp. CBMA 234]